VITILGQSTGIVHDDKLWRYLRYHDHKRVLAEAEECMKASELPKEKLAHFCSRYFR
jgi:hypothetical protein